MLESLPMFMYLLFEKDSSTHVYCLSEFVLLLQNSCHCLPGGNTSLQRKNNYKVNILLIYTLTE